MNNDELTRLITRYCENEETTFVTNIPSFIKLAEERIYNSVLLPVLRRNKTGALTIGNPFLTLPADWLATYSVAAISDDGATDYLVNKDVEFIREAFPVASGQGKPAYYAQYDENTLLLGPTPDAGYTLELHYFYYPPSITVANNTWIGDNFSNVLLYGALREAYIYMKGEKDLLDAYEQKYQEGMQLLKMLGETKNTRDLYRPMR